ncbi:DUF2802 domain-containing protein [Rhodanobacter koreensis]
MALEITVGILLLLALLQSAVLLQLWRQSLRLKQDIVNLTRSVSHAVQTDVPTSMVVSALGRMEQRMAVFEQQPAAASLTPYELAQQLAREGADVEQMVARCGLSRDEARLIRQLHPAGH